ncbi:MAG: translesion DNA synthesis-associated protein ImuA [Oceanococcus sp.]
MTHTALQDVLHHPRIWKGCSHRSLSDQRTGFAMLDRHLPGRGWPRGALIELISQYAGIGELRLLLPVLQNTSQCWIQTPHIPYAPALSQWGISLEQLLIIQPHNSEDALWALGQVLHSGLYSQVLAWHDTRCMTSLRRLQLAAESGGSRLFLFRPAAAAKQASPAVLRLFLEPAQAGLSIRILKSRGGRPHSFILTHDDFVAMPTPTQAGIGRAAPRAA